MPEYTDTAPLRTMQAWNAVINGLRVSFQPLMVYQFLFDGLSIVVFTPLLAAALGVLIKTTGELSLSNNDIINFVISLPGLAALLLAGTASIFLVYANQAGMMIIGAGAGRNQRVSALSALRMMPAKLPKLLGVALVQLLILAAWALPFLGAIGLIYEVVLSDHDINFYLAERPPEFIAFIAVAAILLLVLVLIIAVLLVRWTPAVPLCLFEGKSIRATLQGSRELVRGYAGPIALLMLGWIGLIAIISVLTFAMLDQLNSLVLAAPFESLHATSIAVALLIALSTVLSVVISFAGFTGSALLVVHFYRRLSELKCRTPVDLRRLTRMEQMVHGKAPVKKKRAKIAAVVALLVVTATLTVYRMTDDIRQAESLMIEITAHRGSSEKAPENSLSAIRQAIDDRADYAEIDVQETADGVIVVIHDGDLMRVAGVNRKLWDISYDEIKGMDAGSWFSTEFAGEPIPTLQQVIDLVGDRLKLNIELKLYGHEQKLAKRVVDIIKANRFEERCVITSLDYNTLQQVRSMDSNLRIGHIVTVAIGDVTRGDVDFLSLNSKQVDKALIKKARSRNLGIHAWTINDPMTMVTMVFNGVQNIITDKPDKMYRLREEGTSLTEIEKILLYFGYLMRLDFGVDMK